MWPFNVEPSFFPFFIFTVVFTTFLFKYIKLLYSTVPLYLKLFLDCVAWEESDTLLKLLIKRRLLSFNTGLLLIYQVVWTTEPLQIKWMTDSCWVVCGWVRRSVFVSVFSCFDFFFFLGKNEITFCKNSLTQMFMAVAYVLFPPLWHTLAMTNLEN